MLVLWRAGGCGAGSVSLRCAQHARKRRAGLGSAQCSSWGCHGIALAVTGCEAALWLEYGPLHALACQRAWESLLLL